MIQIIINLINANSIELITFAMSLLAIFFSIYGWHKSRVIYGIDTIIFDARNVDSESNINKKLSSGKYIMLNMIEIEDDANAEYTCSNSVLNQGSLLDFGQHKNKKYRITLGRVKK